MKDRLENSATENEKQSEEIVTLKRQLEDKVKESNCKLQGKDSEISTYKTKEILVDKLRINNNLKSNP